MWCLVMWCYSDASVWVWFWVWVEWCVCCAVYVWLLCMFRVLFVAACWWTSVRISFSSSVTHCRPGFILHGHWWGGRGSSCQLSSRVMPDHVMSWDRLYILCIERKVSCTWRRNGNMRVWYVFAMFTFCVCFCCVCLSFPFFHWLSRYYSFYSPIHHSRHFWI